MAGVSDKAILEAEAGWKAQIRSNMSKQMPNFEKKIQEIVAFIETLSLEKKVNALNTIRSALHEISPFKNEPVDFIKWVSSELVEANDYNPNSVAPPEMELLRLSILEDGYTQPIVAWDKSLSYEVVDGFHRNRVGKGLVDVKQRVHGYLPITVINNERASKEDRIASTIRHNRARGKHAVQAMSEIVIELKKRNWTNEKIAKQLGMDSDEVLRLTQISGIAEAFKNEDFNKAWEVETEADIESISDMFDELQHEDNGRILHTWEKWECYKFGFYSEKPKDKTIEEGEAIYTEFLADLDKFELALQSVINEWKFSCEHYLTNERMNRIAWLGQASVCYALGIPSSCRGGFHRLNPEQQKAADLKALDYLNQWLIQNNREPVTEKIAKGKTEAELY